MLFLTFLVRVVLTSANLNAMHDALRREVTEAPGFSRCLIDVEPESKANVFIKKLTIQRDSQ